jgi:8-oxo-dGTP diphosphatase
LCAANQGAGTSPIEGPIPARGVPPRSPAGNPRHMADLGPRLAARALLRDAQDRLLLVNAWPKALDGTPSALWCAPGGGVERGQSLPDTLRREVFEECGLRIEVGAPAMINEFHDPARAFHQVEVFFHCQMLAETLPDGWTDPAGVVHRRRFFARTDLHKIRFKPDSLPSAAWGRGMIYDPLELIVPP